MEEFNQKEENTFRKNLFGRMDNQDIILERIEEQTKKTNGRVTKLEVTTEDYSEFKKTVSEFTGLKTWIGIVFSLFLVIGGTMGYLFAQNIISEANKYADKILKEQSEQTRKIIIAEVLNSLKTYDKIIIEN